MVIEVTEVVRIHFVIPDDDGDACGGQVRTDPKQERDRPDDLAGHLQRAELGYACNTVAETVANALAA